MTGALANLVLVVVVTGFVAWALALLLTRFVPLGATLKQIMVAFIWVIAVVVIVLYGVMPLLGSLPT